MGMRKTKSKGESRQNNNAGSVSEPRIYRLPQIIEMYNISKPTVYRLMKDGKFPQSVNLGPRARGWFRSALEDWERGLHNNSSKRVATLKATNAGG